MYPAEGLYVSPSFRVSPTGFETETRGCGGGVQWQSRSHVEHCDLRGFYPLKPFLFAKPLDRSRMPQQDGHHPDQIEAYVHQVGLTVQRRLFQVLIEKADQELVLQCRHGKGGAGIQRRGTRPYTFKTIFGEVTVQRSRIRHNHDGTIEILSATAWDTSHQLAITQNLRDAVCDQMSDQSAGKSRADVCQYAGDENLLRRSTVIDIVHQEGEQLIVAQRERARAVLGEASEAQLALLGPAAADPDAVTG